ncbi:MAG UNVERIFIED_CONTAM: hypothetical protein LVR18_34040 [Planctomycetaceae bacterium]
MTSFEATEPAAAHGSPPPPRAASASSSPNSANPSISKSSAPTFAPVCHGTSTSSITPASTISNSIAPFPNTPAGTGRRERRLQITGSEIQLPEGTRFLLRARSAKPLQSVRILTEQFEFAGDEKSATVADRSGGSVTSLPKPLVAADGHTIELPLTIAPNPPQNTPTNDSTGSPTDSLSISSNTNLRFFLHDRDDIISASPETLRVTGLPDKPPVVVAQMSGIGNSVTRRGPHPARTQNPR